MSDLFARLAARAWDRAPRVRPQITPRFARPTARPPIEEAEADASPLAARPSSPPIMPAVETPPPIGAPYETPLGAAPPSAVPPPPLQHPTSLAGKVDQKATEERELRPATVERTVERVVESRVERLPPIETRPLAAPPVPLRAADAAILRAAEPQPVAADMSRRAMVPRLAESRRDDGDESAETIHVSIGRIDVRATPAAAPRAATAAPPRHQPMSLDEYLRRRGEQA